MGHIKSEQPTELLPTPVHLVERSCRGPIVDGAYVAGPNEHVQYRVPADLLFRADGKPIWVVLCPAFKDGICNRVTGQLYPCPMNTPATLQ